jgi:hypothetical protein
MLGVGLRTVSPDDAMIQREMMGTPYEHIGNLSKMIAAMMYGALIVCTVMFQGLNSLYYFTRARILKEYLAQTPPWVVDLQRHQAASR